MVNWTDPAISSLLQDAKEKRCAGEDICLTGLQDEIHRLTGNYATKDDISKRVNAVKLRRKSPPKLAVAAVTLFKPTRRRRLQAAKNALSSVEGEQTEAKKSKSDFQPQVIVEVNLSKFLEQSILTLTDELPGMVRQYRFVYQFRDENKCYYTCAKCEVLNRPNKNGSFSAQVELKDGKVLSEIAVPVHHSLCQPILLQEALAKQIDRECRLTVRNCKMETKIAWQEGLKKCVSMGKHFGLPDRGPHSVMSYFPSFRGIHSQYTLLRKQKPKSPAARRMPTTTTAASTSSNGCQTPEQSYEWSSVAGVEYSMQDEEVEYGQEEEEEDEDEEALTDYPYLDETEIDYDQGPDEVGAVEVFEETVTTANSVKNAALHESDSNEQLTLQIGRNIASILRGVCTPVLKEAAEELESVARKYLKLSRF